MQKFLLVCLLASTVLVVFAASKQDPLDDRNQQVMRKVTVQSEGEPVSRVLAKILVQSKKDFVIEPKISQPIFLSFTNLDFDEALERVCQIANLQYKLQDDIYYIGLVSDHENHTKQKEIPSKIIQTSPKKNRLSKSVLKRNISLDLKKSSLRNVFRTIAQQSRVKIELDSKVPHLILDLSFKKISLKEALDLLTSKLGLMYQFTDHRNILISKPLKHTLKIISGL